MSTLSLRLPNSLHNQAKQLAREDNISINQLVTTALAEKISALRTVEYLENRAKRSSQAEFEKALSEIPDVEPEEYDKL